MPDDVITFVIEGVTERNGNVTADVFLAKLRDFIATVHTFERAFTHRDRRLFDLEVVSLERSNPSKVKMKARSRTPAYAPGPALAWTVDQFDRIYTGRPVDQTVPRSAIDAVVELADHAPRSAGFRVVRVEYESKVIQFDDAMKARALSLRVEQRVEERTTWHAGISKGSLFGELRGVMDIDGERQFYIIPPSGPQQVRCVFSEALRPAMQEHLFGPVRVFGFLRYGEGNPFPYLVEAERIEGVQPPSTHLADMFGAFRGMEPADPADAL